MASSPYVSSPRPCVHLSLPNSLPSLPLLVIYTWPFHLLDLITRIIFGEKYKSWYSSLRNSFQSLATSFFLWSKYLSQHSIRWFFSLYSSLNVRDQISHHTKQQVILQSCRFWSLYFWIANSKTKVSAPRMRANFPCVQSAPSFFMNAILIVVPKRLNFATFSICMLWFYPVFCLPGMNIYIYIYILNFLIIYY